MIAGIDLSSFFVDVMLLTDRSTWVRVDLGKKGDAFDRSRGVLNAISRTEWGPDGRGDYRSLTSLLAGCEAVGIEEPRGMNPGPTFRVQGAVLQAIPHSTLVYPWVPSQWRKAVGLPGNCKKPQIMEFVRSQLGDVTVGWTQDACDAWCIAEATRLAISRGGD